MAQRCNGIEKGFGKHETLKNVYGIIYCVTAHPRHNVHLSKR